MSLSKVVLDLAVSQIRSLLDIEKRVATEVAKYQAAATQQAKELCPSPQEMQKLIDLKVKIEGALQTVAKKSNSQLQTNQSLSKIIDTTQLVIVALKALPAPNVGTTVGITNTSSDVLRTVSNIVDSSEGAVDASTQLLSLVKNLSRQLQVALQQLNIIILFCTGSEEEAQAIADSLEPEEEKITLPQDYRGYKLDIVNIKNFEDNLVRRQAVALYPNGVVAFKSSQSFATSDEVLLEQVKIQIDRSITPQGDTIDDIITSTIDTTAQRSSDATNRKNRIPQLELQIQGLEEEIANLKFEELDKRIDQVNLFIKSLKQSKVNNLLIKDRIREAERGRDRLLNLKQDKLTTKRELETRKSKLQAEIFRLNNF